MLSLKAFLGLDATGYELGIRRAETATRRFTGGIMGELRGKLGALLTFAAAESFGRKVVQTASRVKDLSDALEMSTDEFQRWEHAATQAGGKAANVEKFFNSLSEARERALSGDATAMKAFKKFGVSPSDLSSNRLGAIGQNVGNAFRSGDSQILTPFLKEIGGKGGLALRAAFKAGLDEAFQIGRAHV